jgi:putative tryptophan/tyrosine transport system substrate-binding protein
MRRRDFIAGLGSAASQSLLPMAGRAQQRAMPIIGVLLDGDWTPEASAALAQGLAETGYAEGRNVAIEYRFVSENVGSLQESADDLIRRQVAVIATPGSTPAALAAKAGTATIPIVFGIGFDPVQLGLVASLNRPGANLTGYTEMQVDVVSKRLELLRMLAPAAVHYGALIDPRNPIGEQMAGKAREAAESIGKPMEVISVSDDAAFKAVFLNLPQTRIDAMLFSPGQFFYKRRELVLQLTASHGVPAAYWLREFPETGGLMSYGSSYAEMNRRVGAYVGRILNGAKPADLPIVRATKFELVINARAAKALGLTIPPTLLAIADEVIE